MKVIVTHWQGISLFSSAEATKKGWRTFNGFIRFSLNIPLNNMNTTTDRMKVFALLSTMYCTVLNMFFIAN
jgi:hypothetical protein